MDIGGWELAIVAVVILVFFGGKKLPEMARGLGTAKREFEDAIKSDKKSVAVKEKSDDATAKSEAKAKAKSVANELNTVETSEATDAAATPTADAPSTSFD